MGRKQVKINAIRGKRLGELLKEHGIDQREFAREINYSEEHISYIINGKRNLTPDAAEKIVEKFPGTRIGWLLGYEDYKTNRDKIGAVAQEKLDNQLAVETIFDFAADFLGYRLESPETHGITRDETFSDDGIKLYNADEVWNLLIKDNIHIKITQEDIDTFRDELVRYAMFLIEGLINKKNDSWHPFWIGKEILDDGKYSGAPGQDRQVD